MNFDAEKATEAAKKKLQEALVTLDVLQIQQAISDAQAVFSEGPELTQAQADLRGIKALKKFDLAFKKGKGLKGAVIDLGKVILACNLHIQSLMAEKMNSAVTMMMSNGEEVPDLDAKVLTLMAETKPVALDTATSIVALAPSVTVTPPSVESGAAAVASPSSPALVVSTSSRVASSKMLSISSSTDASASLPGRIASDKKLSSPTTVEGGPPSRTSSKRLGGVIAVGAPGPSPLS
jgi:hypothetical protein